MINNNVAKCALDDYTSDLFNPSRDEIKFDLRYKCKIGKRSVHRASDRKKAFANGSYGFFCLRCR